MLVRKLPGNLKYLLMVLLCIAALSSCETKGPQCFQPVVVSANTGFAYRYLSIVVDSIPTVPPQITYDTVELTKDSNMVTPEMVLLGKNLDSTIILLGANPTTGFSLPFDPGVDSIQYRFRADTTAANHNFDTITFHYSNKLHFISNSCGYTFYFTINSVTTKNRVLDSVVVLDPNVTEDISKKNVTLYFKRNY